MKVSTENKMKQNNIMTLDDKEQEIVQSRALLHSIKENSIEMAKIGVRIRDKYNTAFYLSPEKANDKEYIHQLTERLNETKKIE